MAGVCKIPELKQRKRSECLPTPCWGKRRFPLPKHQLCQISCAVNIDSQSRGGCLGTRVSQSLCFPGKKPGRGGECVVPLLRVGAEESLLYVHGGGQQVLRGLPVPTAYARGC